MSGRVTAPSILAKKGRERIVCVTAYDAVTGAIADEAGVDIVLVGDSVGNVMLGYDSTLPVTLDDMLHHTAAVAAVVDRALIVADMPFGSYQASTSAAVESAVELVRVGAQAVKLEGPYTDEIRAIVRAGIPVMGHLGMTPQSIHSFGGHKVQGKSESDSEMLLAAARQVADAGAFSMVLELVPAALAGRVTAEAPCPTIGIGAGPECDGQVQVFHDVAGLSPTKYKHAKRYAEGYALFREAIERYASEVRSAEFPTKEHSF
ncbi:MAG: 3-methyl-2-oxobutanoate hydroxymethyltransferase [Fimbriimonadaceae bacterium]|uniref:3-methyl-2-oxobutanoate hydroxymethyltransferase n=1 Tax=Candidatus Nitrosymbiomonas proteolyticus TaxID=2608984 RepID=A0A809S1Z1_9BACT|nr:3-methyl-2-oxobutanoate hydroxymethyltransferase [Fimbriimonadaceae bacterium]NUM39052.1 3-methyl-2-oxobutanoate hydroxymethyltransferase [Armatimonadota bacterium]BBO22577.1 3-methyl-2-oxobutanoate hydroxymethyltransferase [Candidatus Nitrosymbiomonas proteolyticus]MCZ7580087.1 3-methyl-2-oxobutanoate hydroxymethyltransferase [Fimbriimonadaceae bacterium]WKZ81355.1 MAG: 3-methyl-2-oxobutanoate hydroxymethyltransferase [Fimbriimonadaceae bacterium]